MFLEILDIFRVIALVSFVGGTSFLGASISKYKKLDNQQILILTAIGASVCTRSWPFMLETQYRLKYL